MTTIDVKRITEFRQIGLSVGEALVCILSADGMDMKEISIALKFTPQAARHAYIRGKLKLPETS